MCCGSDFSLLHDTGCGRLQWGGDYFLFLWQICPLKVCFSESYYKHPLFSICLSVLQPHFEGKNKKIHYLYFFSMPIIFFKSLIKPCFWRWCTCIFVLFAYILVIFGLSKAWNVFHFAFCIPFATKHRLLTWIQVCSYFFLLSHNQSIPERTDVEEQ